MYSLFPLIIHFLTEFKLASDWVAKDLNMDQNRMVQLFEVVIRELGGLMSAYYLSADKVFLDKAVSNALCTPRTWDLQNVWCA